MTPDRMLNLERAGIVWEVRMRRGRSKTKVSVPQNGKVMSPTKVAAALKTACAQLPGSAAVATNKAGVGPDEDKDHDWTAEALGGDWAQQHESANTMGALTFPHVGPVTNRARTGAGPHHEATAPAFDDGLGAVPTGDEWAPAPLGEIPVTPTATQTNKNRKVGPSKEQKTTPGDVAIGAEVPLTETRKRKKKSGVGQKKRPRSVGGNEGKPEAEELAFMGVAEAAWQVKIEALKKYKEKHGNILVPNKYQEDMALGRWVKNMRWEWTKLKNGTKSRLTPERIKVLDDLGFAWTVKKGSVHARKSSDGETVDFWTEKYEDLEKFHAEHGHTLVPNRYKSDMSLGAWVKTQRWEMKKLKRGDKSSMTDEKINALEKLDFIWAPLEGELTGQDLWLKRYSELKEYKEKTGNCLVPRKYSENMSLGNWVTTQSECSSVN